MGIAFLIFCFAASLSAQIKRQSKPFNIEVGLTFGSTMNYDYYGSSYFYGSWIAWWFDIDSEYGDILPELSMPLLFGANISLITRMGIGVQFALDYNSKSDITGSSNYYASGFDYWYWEDISESNSWDVTGIVKMMVLSLDVIYKYQRGMFNPWFAAGGSYYTGSIEAFSEVGWGFEDPWLDFDYLSLPVEINEDLSGIGFNVGAGADIQFTQNIAFTIEGRYFILKKYELYWLSDASGQFTSYVYDVTYTFANPSAFEEGINEIITPFEFNPSFAELAVGVKFSF